MSTVQSRDNPFFVEGFDSDDPNARVYVNDREIPTVEKTLYVRNEGPLDFTRYFECQFAGPHHGEDYTWLFDALTPTEQREYDIVRVEGKDAATSEYVPVF